jgi:triosephosphate isomerase
MRTPIIAGNWKMNLTLDEGIELVKALEVHNKVDVIVAPSFVNLFSLNNFVKQLEIPVKIAAQNMHYEESGAYTGEVSVGMLQAIAIDRVIIGHSERRDIFKETDEMLKLKVNKAVEFGMDVIFCVGEHLEEREAGKAEDVVLNQIDIALSELNNDNINQITIAYEPVWAIGTGKTATKEDAEAMHLAIRNKISEKFNSNVAEMIRILYGGSVKPENISELMSMPNIDGALVGGASLKPDSFNAIINYK